MTIKFLIEYMFFGRTIKNLLLKSEEYLKFDTPDINLKNNPNEYCKKVFFEYLNEGEWGLASDVLVHIIMENQPDLQPKQEFWKPFYKAQNMMKRRDVIIFCKENGFKGEYN